MIPSDWDTYYAGYEVEGLENIPESGPALLIYYHGALPIDMYYVIAKLLLYKHRLLHPVGDRFLFYIPGNVLYVTRSVILVTYCTL